MGFPNAEHHERELTDRQRHVLDLIARGQTNAEIAADLGITLDGAKWNVSEILTKLGLSSREEAAEYWRWRRQPAPRTRRALRAMVGLPVVLKAASVLVLFLGLAAAAVVFGPHEVRVTFDSWTPVPGPDDDPWEAPHRPLALPSIPAGGACPASPGRRVTSQFGAGSGPGPVYVVLVSLRAAGQGQMDYGLGNAYVGEWGGQKTLWYVDPAYTGPVLIRGSRIDGPGEVRFNYGVEALASEMHLPQPDPFAGPGEWRSAISSTRLKVSAPGCYAFQVDGDTFSYSIVFLAVVTD